MIRPLRHSAHAERSLAPSGDASRRGRNPVVARLKIPQSGRQLCRGERHLVAELAQLVERPAARPQPPLLVQGSYRRLPVLLPVLQYVVDDCQDAVPHRDDGALLAGAGDQAAIEPGQRTPPRLLGPRRLVRRLSQGAPQPPTPLARLAAGALPSALVAARARVGSAGQVRCVGEATHSGVKRIPSYIWQPAGRWS